MNKKIFLSLLLVLLVAVSVTAVAADEDVAAVNDADIAVDDSASEVVLADEPAAPVSEPQTINVEEETWDAITTAIDSANDGDTIQLKENGIFDASTNEVTITKANLTIKGTNTIINVQGTGQVGGKNDGTFTLKGAGITIQGIIFNNTDGQKPYGEAVNGCPISCQGDLQTIKDCQSLFFNKGVMCMGSTNTVIDNCYITGSTQSATGTGTGEKGTYGVAGGNGVKNVTVSNCIFDGQMLDGISFYSSSQVYTIINNTFNNNVYAIYFGGASTKGSVITGNRFIRCGECYDADGNILIVDGKPVQGLTVISAEKAADAFSVTGNEFIMTQNGYAIKTQQGNTAHGYPSTIGNINITGNTVSAAEDADPNTITFVHILSNGGPLSPYAPIVITGNTIEAGITPVTVWYADWGDEGGDVVIPATDKAPTFISIEKVSTADNEIIVKLEDTNGEALADKTITYTIAGGEEKTATTDAEGKATIGDLTNGEIVLSYAGDDKTQECSATVTFTSTASERIATEIVYQNMTTTAVDTKTDGRIGKYFYITLKDAEGVALANKHVQIGFNGVVYDRDTDENGQARLQINLKAEGVYTFAVAFLGDDQYNGSFVVAKITVSKQTGSLTVPAKTYKASAATKSLTATFKSAKGGLVAGKKVTFTVNGKTYSATTNAKGVATVKVSLNTKGTYSFTAKFAGDSTYAAISKTAKLTIN